MPFIVRRVIFYLVAAWVALIGLGLGITFATAASAALVEIPQDRSGVASALMQALQKAGGPLGAAIMGSVLSSVYLSTLQLTGLPPALAGVVRQSLFGGLEVAEKLHALYPKAEPQRITDDLLGYLELLHKERAVDF